MKVTQATIHSDLRKEGQIYQVSDEVEQNLTILEDGTVRLDAISHEGLPCWQEEKEIEKEICQNILSMLDEYANNPSDNEEDNAGQWEMHLQYEDGSEVTLTGPMVGKVFAGDVDLTEYIREHMPFMSLGVFDTTEAL